MAEVIFSKAAINDLKEIKEYISTELSNETAAMNTVKKIMQQIRTLEIFPNSGTLLDSITNIESPYRFLVCGNYMAFYRTDDDLIKIIRVLYGRRNYLKILFGDISDN